MQLICNRAVWWEGLSHKHNCKQITNSSPKKHPRAGKSKPSIYNMRSGTKKLERYNGYELVVNSDRTHTLMPEKNGMDEHAILKTDIAFIIDPKKNV